MTQERVSPRPERREGREHGALLALRNLLIVVAIAMLASFLVKTFVIRSFYIPSGSMENTLQINDRITVNELEPRFLPIHRGDIVVFKDPGGWLPASMEKPVRMNPVEWALSVVGLAAPESNDHLVKRVIGLPGDHVSCCNARGELVVDGTPISEPYIVVPADATNASTVRFDVTVPKGDLWVMGDNRYKSQDSSRNQNLPGKGFVPIKDVVGRAVIISWPVARWAWLSDHPTVFRHTTNVT